MDAENLIKKIYNNIFKEVSYWSIIYMENYASRKK